jgi:serine/threonine-protein phosphatase PGAM5
MPLTTTTTTMAAALCVSAMTTISYLNIGVETTTTTLAEKASMPEGDNQGEEGEDKKQLPSRRPTGWIPSWPRRNSENNQQSPSSKRPTKVRGRLSAVRNVSDDELFEGQCLKRQMYTPKVPYPAWDYNWDNRMTSETSLEAFRDGLQNVVSVDENKIINTEQNVILQQKQQQQQEQERSNESTETSSPNKKKKKRKAKTRHIILVRHGQYEETQHEDGRVLTPLGRYQARQTGKRLAQIAQGSRNFYPDEFNGPCRIKAIHVSDLIRAKETANLIAEQLLSHLPRNKPAVQPPDPMLNEALPAPVTPIRPDIPDATEEIDANRARVEQAFHKYFYRDVDTMVDENNDDEEEEDDGEFDEFEIIVGHGNLIRFFFCRAMQLPPEAWLRFSTFNCSITYLVIRPDGMVSARAMGDVGHLTYDQTTFSGYHGYKW